jgi:hypothetical protein
MSPKFKRFLYPSFFFLFVFEYLTLSLLKLKLESFWFLCLIISFLYLVILLVFLVFFLVYAPQLLEDQTRGLQHLSEVLAKNIKDMNTIIELG